MKKLALSILTSFSIITLYGQSRSPGVKLQISIEESQEIVNQIDFSYWRNPTFSQSLIDGRFESYPIIGLPIKIEIDSIYSPSRISLFGRRIIPNDLFADQLIEPNDSVSVTVKIGDDAKWIMKVSGNGSAKYSIAAELAPIELEVSRIEGRVSESKLPVIGSLKLLDSLKEHSIAILNSKRVELSDLAFQVLKADMASSFMKTQILLLSNAYATATGKEKEIFLTYLRYLMDEPPIELSHEYIPYSRQFLDTEYQKNKWKIVFRNNPDYKDWEFSSSNSNVSFKEVFDLILSQYENPIKENLLAFALLNSVEIKLFFSGAHPQEYTYCLNKAIVQTSNIQLKQMLTDRRNRFGLGSKVPSLSLPNEFGNTIQISDFIGKVILIDIWTLGCTACLDVKADIDRILMPVLYDQKDFKIISIGAAVDSTKWLAAITSQSRPEFVNLFLDSGNSSKDFLEFYEMSFAPLLLLVDKDGNLVTSTVRNISLVKDLVIESLAR